MRFYIFDQNDEFIDPEDFLKKNESLILNSLDNFFDEVSKDKFDIFLETTFSKKYKEFVNNLISSRDKTLIFHQVRGKYLIDFRV